MPIKLTEITNDPQYQLQKRFLEIDERIKIQTDIFNAETISINQVKQEIDANPEIPQSEKYSRLAAIVDDRFQKLTDVLFGLRKETTEAESKQRALQIFFNEFAKNLRKEEREKLRIQDQTYVVKEPPKTVKAPTVKKYDKDEIKRTSSAHGIPEAVLQMLCVQFNCTPLEAVRKFNEAKAGLKKD